MRSAALLASYFSLFALCGCASHGTLAPGAPTLPLSKLGPGHDVKQGGPKPITWVQLPSSRVDLTGLVVGPDKNLWFPTIGNRGLGTMTMTGVVT